MPYHWNKKNKGRTRQCWIDNINEDITWTNTKRTVGIDKDKGLRTMEIIYL